MAMELMYARGLLYRGLVRCIPLRVNTIPSALGAQRSFASNTQDQGFDEEGLKEAREWLSSFTRDSIPREYCDVSFSRSSGPGKSCVFFWVLSWASRVWSCE